MLAGLLTACFYFLDINFFVWQVDMQSPLPELIRGMGDPLPDWAWDAELGRVCDYVRYSKYITLPEEYRNLM